MTVGELQLALVREIWIKSQVVVVLGRAINVSAEWGIRIVVWVIWIAFAIFEFYTKEWFKSITRRFESLCLTFSFQLQFVKGFESITQKFESSCLVLHNSRFRDSNRCVGDSNPCFNLFTYFHEGFESLYKWFKSVALNFTFFFTRDSNLLDEIRIIPFKHPLLESRFEFVEQGFESWSSSKLTGTGIRITSTGIWITIFRFFSLHFLK